MIFRQLTLAGAYMIDSEWREDKRGFFGRVFCVDEFADQGLPTSWVQVNISFNRRAGTVRGMHFQRPPAAEAKLVRCIRGSIFDVIVDLREGSQHYGRWISVELTAANRSMLYVPAGFAHGFQSLEPHTELLYFHDTQYDAALQGGLNPFDPEIGVRWPLAVEELSPRDSSLPGLSDLEPLRL